MNNNPFHKKKKKTHYTLQRTPLQRTDNNQLQIHKKNKKNKTHYKQLITHKH